MFQSQALATSAMTLPQEVECRLHSVDVSPSMCLVSGVERQPEVRVLVPH